MTFNFNQGLHKFHRLVLLILTTNCTNFTNYINPYNLFNPLFYYPILIRVIRVIRGKNDYYFRGQ